MTKAEKDKRIEELEAVFNAAKELLEVADLRGDSSLPHPANDPKLWTARMQTAWDDLRATLDAEKKGKPIRCVQCGAMFNPGTDQDDLCIVCFACPDAAPDPRP